MRSKASLISSRLRNAPDLADQCQRAIHIQQRQVGREVVLHWHRVDDEVETRLRRAHCRRIGRDDEFVGTQRLGIHGLGVGSAQYRDVRPHAGGELDRHVTQAAQSDHRYPAAMLDIPGPQRRPPWVASPVMRSRPE
ncbi:hypothetical protein G6F22_018517 [Rhizopus arrhizus]|nr:hypothetical protein G6F22_018517 [Rhizopus arrhizus]